MPRAVETNRVYLRRLNFKHRHIQVNRKQTDVHLKKKKTEPRTLTPGEKEARKARRADKKEYETKKLAEAQEKVWQLAVGLAQDLGKTADHWHQSLMQLARLAKASRKTSLWNAFVSLRIMQRNEALPEGAAKVSVNDPGVMAELSQEWAVMSEEEHQAVAGERTKQLAEDRETKATGTHTVSINAFHDVNATVVQLENMLRDLWLRTGTECLLFVVRSSVEHYNRPAVVESSPRVKNYFKFSFNQLPSQWVLSLEAHCVNGMNGVKNKYAEDLQTMQSECSAKIFEQLQLATAPANVGRMNYENFGTLTRRHRIVYQNWPVTFCSPVRLNTVELHTLHDLLHGPNPPSLFRHLTNSEYVVFEDAIKRGTLETLPPLPPTNVPVPTLLPGPSNSVPSGRSGANTDDLDTTDLAPRSTMGPPASSATSSPPPPSNPLIRIPSTPSTSSALTPSTPSTLPAPSTFSPPTPSTSTSVAAPPPAPRGGIVISFNGKQSTLVAPKPRAKRRDADMTVAERNAANAALIAEKLAKKAEKQARKAASKGTKTRKRQNPGGNGATDNVGS
ncbi:hypothetical protein QCA50_005663 [Cerrena zonata]|uniref:Uncharacterized protein n=1 Tax=Cerrena zonata TaxID=2478898 RepID=A0AAW0GN36_9APHY